ncbi:uncharacterized protein [Diadema setosum]|uniref:uncharacterized protein n=1 Tax=Diadema setosum TaxID=31175 RepID=UPI003B3A1ED5
MEADELALVDDGNLNVQVAAVAKGLGVFTTGLFLVGEVAGTGVLALPRAVVDTGWIGLFLIAVAACMLGYTGIILGRCWTIVKERFPEKYGGHTRYPYPAIGSEAFGKVGRYSVRFCVIFTMFGASVVFLLLAADNMHSLVGKSLNFCQWPPIIAACLMPLCWLGTPKDFWIVATGASMSTGLAALLLVVQSVIEIPAEPPNHTSPTVISFLTAFGTIVFAFGGHGAFPTIQHDMRDPRRFYLSICLGYCTTFLIYIPVAAAGYFVFGDKFIELNTDNILYVISKGAIHTVVTVMIMMHLVLSFVICINPVFQEIEEAFCIPLKFTWKRVVMRTLVVGLVLFTGETIPHFGTILSLVGGSTVTLQAAVFPPLFYLRLNSMKDPAGKWKKRQLSLHHKVILIEISLIGVVGGAASTFSVIYSMATGASQFTVPCYVNSTGAHL